MIISNDSLYLTFNKSLTFRDITQVFIICNLAESNKDISVRLGMMWKNLSYDTKESYYSASRAADEEHKRKYPGYYYSPKEARLRKSLKHDLAMARKSPKSVEAVHLVKVCILFVEFWSVAQMLAIERLAILNPFQLLKMLTYIALSSFHFKVFWQCSLNFYLWFCIAQSHFDETIKLLWDPQLHHFYLQLWSQNTVICLFKLDE